MQTGTIVQNEVKVSSYVHWYSSSVFHQPRLFGPINLPTRGQFQKGGDHSPARAWEVRLIGIQAFFLRCNPVHHVC